MLAMFAITPVMPTSAAPASLPSIAYGAEFVDYEAEFSEFAPCPRGTFRVRRNTRTKKKLVNSLLAGGVGTLIGAGVAGKRGALIGAGSGAGGYLVYRYVRDRRGRCVARRA